MLSSETIELAIRALKREQDAISYSPLAYSSETDLYKYAVGAIKMHDGYECAIMELEVERQIIMERENAIKA